MKHFSVLSLGEGLCAFTPFIFLQILDFKRVMLLKSKTLFTRTKYQRNKIGHKHRQINPNTNFHKAVITLLKSTETLKNRSVTLLNQNPSLHNSFHAKN